jgi:Asp-tRNA(Asn)/Glu-tRNA(Gln) amidotransferase A subunit family amidase
VAVKEAETGRRREGSAYVPHGLTSPIRGAEGGVLTGLTAVVKDVFDIAGERTGAGSPEWLADAGISHATAPAVQQMLDAGAAVVAKTVCDELMFSITGSNAHYGTPLNPRVPDRLPGGSSSGSASATASGACDIALGTDTAGSVRVPAALCGVFGLRTTHGRVSMAGVVPMAPSFDSVGWFAPTAGLLRLAGGALLGSGARRAEVVRIRLATDLIAAADGHVAAAAQDFVARGRRPRRRQHRHRRRIRRGVGAMLSRHPGLRNMAILRTMDHRAHARSRPGYRRADAIRLDGHRARSGRCARSQGRDRCAPP